MREERKGPMEPDRDEGRRRRPRRRRHMRVWQIVLIMVGALTIFYLLMRFIIVPVLVMIGGNKG